MNEKKKSCFVITPIGENDTEIRRHIDRVIDKAINPALGDKFTITPAHRIDESGSITNQVIDAIYSSDLVIANLTYLNPNVMYELAFRHTIGKPYIQIAEVGTVIPFDINPERTVFYSMVWGGDDLLIEKLKSYESRIDYSDNGRSGVIYNRLKSKGIVINFSGVQEPTATELTELTELTNKLKNKISRAQYYVKSSNFVKANDSIVGPEGILDLTKELNRMDARFLDDSQIIEAMDELQGLKVVVDALALNSQNDQSALNAATNYQMWIEMSFDNLEKCRKKIARYLRKIAQNPPTPRV